MGAWGVSIFLILSGYLSAKFLIYKEDCGIIELIKLAYTKLKSRLIKIYPLHFFTLLISIPFSYKVLFIEMNLTHWLLLVLNITLLQAWIPVGVYNWVSWYLSVFLFLSFIGIPICYLFQKNSFFRDKSVCICFILVLIQYVIFLIFKDFSIAHKIIYIFPLSRFIDYLIGISLLYVSVVIKDFFFNKFLVIAALVMGFINIYFSFGSKSEIFSVVVWSIPSCFLICGTILNTAVGNFLFGNKIMVWLGNISFELFLIHQLVIRYTHLILRKFGYTPDIFAYLTVLVLSIILALLWQYLIDKIKQRNFNFYK